MATQPISNARHYPNQRRLETNLHDEFRTALDKIYTLQDQVRDLHGQLADAHARIGKQEKAGVSSTKINGLSIKGILPTQGNPVASLSQTPVLGYNQKSGQIEWYVPA